MVRIAFLDSNYAYDRALGHKDKLVKWLAGPGPPLPLRARLQRRGRLAQRQVLRQRRGRHLGQKPRDAARPGGGLQVHHARPTPSSRGSPPSMAASNSSSRRTRRRRSSTPSRWSGTASSTAWFRARPTRAKATSISARALTRSGSALNSNPSRLPPLTASPLHRRQLRQRDLHNQVLRNLLQLLPDLGCVAGFGNAQAWLAP